MKVYGFTSKAEGIMEVGNSLKPMQEFVGGLIEVIGLTPELDLVCNDEGKINNMPPTAAWLDHNSRMLDVICGSCFVCRHDDKGNFTSIWDEDVEIINRIMIRCFTL